MTEEETGVQIGTDTNASLTPPHSRNIGLLEDMCGSDTKNMLQTGMVHAPYMKGVLMGLHVRGSTSLTAAAPCCQGATDATAKWGGCRMSSSRGEDVAGLKVVAYRSGSEGE